MSQRLWRSDGSVPSMPEWFGQQREAIGKQLLAPPGYPCHFATVGELSGGNYYSYLDLDADEAAELDEIARVLSAFLIEQRARAGDRLTLLVLVGPPDPALSFQAYRSRFWSILEGIRQRDRERPPAGMPADVNDPRWELHFDGEALFSFGACPAYGPRRSRVLAQCLVVALQSRSIFRDLRGDTAAGQAAKRRIRRSLVSYDETPLIADAGDGLGSTQHKWRQYFPDVDGRPASGSCPIRRP